MSKLSIVLDPQECNKAIFENTYTNKYGDQVTKQELRFELIELRDEKKKLIHEGPKVKITKTHFAIKEQTPEERKEKADYIFLGQANTIEFFNPDAPAASTKPVEDDLPF